MEITTKRSEGLLFLTLSGYVEKVLEKFGMAQSKLVSTPLAQHFKLTLEHSPQTDLEKTEIESFPYASAVGSIMYAMVCCRPDLAYSASVVSRFMSNSGLNNWYAVK